LPLIALQYHNVDIEVNFNQLNMLYTFGQFDYYTASGTISTSVINVIKLNSTSRDITVADKAKIVVFADGLQYYIHPTTAITGAGSTSSPYVITLTKPLTKTYTNNEIYIKPNGELKNTVSMNDCRM